VTDADIQFGAPRVRRLGDQVAEQIGGSSAQLSARLRAAGRQLCHGA
jgi:hypothetical protein